MTLRRTRTLALLLAGCAPETPAPDTDAAAADSDTDIPPETDLPSPPERLSLVAGPACVDPTLRTSLGPLPMTAGGDFASQPVEPDRRERYTGGGVTAVDIDGDGDLDLLRPDPDAVHLWRRTAPDVLVADDDALPQPAPSRTNVITGADVDGDGDLDLVLGRDRALSLWRNDGTGRFTDATAAAGLDVAPASRVNGISLGDLDLDGDLDLLAAGFGAFGKADEQPGDRSSLWRNDGAGGFTHDPDALPAEVRDGYTFVAGFWDADRDGWPDVYVVNDFGHQYENRFVRNDAGTLRLRPEVGLDVSLQGMGLGIGDVDADGDDDVVVAGWGNNRLLLQESGQWFDVHATAGLDGDRAREQVIGWATELADVDHDGDLDVVEGFGHVRGQTTAPVQPDALFLNAGDGTFTDVGEAWGFAHPGQTRGVLAVDVDADGWLDLLRGDVTGPVTEQRARCGDAAWLTVRLDDTTVPNHAGIGARVEVRVGGRTWSRWVVAGGRSVLASGPSDVSIGLGDADHIDELTIVWPTGAPDHFFDLPVRHFVTVHR